ncbi:MAG: 16S rRNA (cytosine(1402)-N(4))-methyltransferase RsmH [Nitrospirae bacterium]|nr:16S rRNA (cytosine(1402)-N(4))-methyltransferase RsmH [Nitrospirota bacterium]
MSAEHIPVLLSESVHWLGIKPEGLYADLTLGLGGHSEAILERLSHDGRLVGLDRDTEAIEIARARLDKFSGRLTIIKGEFRDAAANVRAAGIEALDGFLMDLGVSSMQLKVAGRGFSFMNDAPLDMRMDRETGRTAAGVLAELDEAELTRIIFRYGEERWAKSIARRIAERSKTSPIETTLELAEEVKRAIPRKFWPPRTHPATRTFQALRIYVNDEMGSLRDGLEGMLGMLKPGGRAVVISYHSLEDRIVKEKFREWSRGCTCPPDFPVCVCGKRPRLKVLTKKPVEPGDAETSLNPSARSARLRAAERL